MKKTALLCAALLTLAGALAAVQAPAPPPEEDLVSCIQVAHSDGTCDNFCTFYGRDGQAQGYIHYEGCA